MSSIYKCGEKWRAQVKVAGQRFSKVWGSKDQAVRWAVQLDSKLRRKAEIREMINLGVDIPNFPTQIMQAVHDAPLSYDQIVAAAMPADIICGVYFLILRERIIYVGQSVNTLHRISTHKKNGYVFDSFTIVPCARDDLDKMESIYIRACWPDDNKMLGNA